VVAEGTEHSANQRSQREAHRKGADVGARDADIRREGATQDPGDEEPLHRGRKTGEKQRPARASSRHQHDRAAADPVREPSPDRGEQELHGGVARDQESQHAGARLELLDDERQHGDHDPEAHEIDNHDAEENRESASALHGSCREAGPVR